MKELTVQELYDLNETIAGELFEGVTYPWEVLPKIGEFIVKLGNTQPEDEYEKKGENISIAKSAKVAPSAYITHSQSSAKTLRSGTVHLSVETRW